VRRRLQDQIGSGTSTSDWSVNKKNAQTVRERNTAADIAEAQQMKSKEGEHEHEDKDGEEGGGQRTQLQKRRQTHSFYFATEPDLSL